MNWSCRSLLKNSQQALNSQAQSALRSAGSFAPDSGLKASLQESAQALWCFPEQARSGWSSARIEQTGRLERLRGQGAKGVAWRLLGEPLPAIGRSPTPD